MEKRVDKRVRRTKRLVREALLRLMASKPVEKVTTTELCAEADINRNTFYAHYATPEDVLDEIEAELFADLNVQIQQGYEQGDMTLAICRHIAENRTSWQSVWNGNPALLQHAVDYFNQQALALWSMEGLDDMDEGILFLRFAAQGSLCVIERWLNGGCRQSPEEISSLIDRFVFEGRQGVGKRR